MDTPDRYDVFISYPREELGFAQQLRDYLQAIGKVCWLDAHDIRQGQEWWPAIVHAIERSACVVCLVSPAFQRSHFCRAEARQARALKKKLVLVLWPEAGAIPAALAHISAIPRAATASANATGELVHAVIEHDFEYARQRRELLARACGWREAGRRNSLLLRDADLDDACTLLARCSSDGLATDLQAEYVAAARRFRRHGLAWRGGTVAAVLLLGIALCVTARVAYDLQRYAPVSYMPFRLSTFPSGSFSHAAFMPSATWMSPSSRIPGMS